MSIRILLVEGKHATAEELRDVLIKLGHKVTLRQVQETDLIVQPATLELNEGGSREELEGASADAGEITWEAPAGDRSETFKMIATSPAMRQLLNFARRAAQSEVSALLLEGESGTGKDILARFLHHHSHRKRGPFVSVNCAAIPETLLESELFGYEKGAFTDARSPKPGILEMASNGSIFLDEIGEMSPSLQAKLLHVLEHQSFRRLGGLKDIRVDSRIIAASNRSLTTAVEQGIFRLDLYYRLNVLQMIVPPLREREEDILPLAELFMEQYNRKFKREIRGISHAALTALLAHSWPGNVRELRNVIERAMVLEESERIRQSSIRIGPNGFGANHPASDLAQFSGLPATWVQVERHLVSQALEKANGNQTRAASLLGITRDTLRYKMKKFGASSESACPAEAPGK